MYVYNNCTQVHASNVRNFKKVAFTHLASKLGTQEIKSRWKTNALITCPLKSYGA